MTVDPDNMLNKPSIAAMALSFLAMSAPAQAGYTSGLLLNDDSAQIHISENEPGPLFNIEALEETEVHKAYNLLYSQEPYPRNYLLGAEIEFPAQAWEIRENQKLIPRVDLIVAKFMSHYLSAVAAGVDHNTSLTLGDYSFNLATEATFAPPLTTLGRGKFLWTFKTQLNYPLVENVQLNLGYRNITMELLNNFQDGFERGLYFGLTTRFE